MKPNKPQKILIIAQHYAPEEVSGAVLATELAEGLVILGNQVTFLTCAPNYPAGIVFNGYKNTFLNKENRNGVQIIRVWSYISKSKSNWKRLLNIGTFCFMAFWGGIFAKKPDIIFSYSPPLPLGVSAWLLSKLWRAPWILRVEDLFPDTAISSKIIKNQFLIRISYMLEKFLYQKCSHISVISDGFKRLIAKKGISSQKISVQPVWSDPAFIQPKTKGESFKGKFGLSKKFVFLYAGNIGQTSCLEDIVCAADRLRNNSRISFVIIGEGIKKQIIQQRTKDLSLSNILLLPYQPREQLPEIMASADVGLVTINDASADYSLPSKVFSIMASSRPVLSIAPRNSDLGKLVTNKKTGINIPPNEINDLVEAILYLSKNSAECIELGKNGRRTVLDNYAKDNVIKEYDNLIKGFV